MEDQSEAERGSSFNSSRCNFDDSDEEDKPRSDAEDESEYGDEQQEGQLDDEQACEDQQDLEDEIGGGEEISETQVQKSEYEVTENNIAKSFD